MGKAKKKKRPSMKDVADLAGVSRTTVSFVLNEVPNANIPLATRERVMIAVEELGYRPNALARGLRAQRTHTIGFISDEIATTPYAGRTIQGAQDLAWEYQSLILLVNTSGDDEMRLAAINNILDRRVDAIIYATMYHRECHPPDIIHQVPTVLLDCFVADHSLPSVVPDEVLGGYQATRHLLQEGHKRVGFINDVHTVPAAIGRLQGYSQALAEFGLPFDDSLVTHGRSEQAGGYDGVMTLMSLDQRPTALFCFNDRMAMGAYDALRKLNLAIPDDVAVIGFDNQEIIAAHLYPSLTTMQLPHYEMGRWAVQHLLDLIDKPDKQAGNPPQHKIHCPLVHRESA
jgi:LacI family transcriptional regulator